MDFQDDLFSKITKKDSLSKIGDFISDVLITTLIVLMILKFIAFLFRLIKKLIVYIVRLFGKAFRFLIGTFKKSNHSSGFTQTPSQ